MTDESKRENILVEVRRAEDSLEAAKILLAAGKLADAVSRAYYACFHYARAMLLTEGHEARSHGGVERMLHRDFVRKNEREVAGAEEFRAAVRSFLESGGWLPPGSP